MSGNVCDVCEREGIVGVASSALGPCSFAYCKSCLENGCEPYEIAVRMFATCGGSPEPSPGEHPSVTPYWKQMMCESWTQGALETMFVSTLRAGKTSDEFWKDVLDAVNELSKMS